MSIRAITQSEVAGGLVLVAATAVALALANSPLSAAYAAWLNLRISLGGSASPTIHFLINDGLMAVFFLVVGIEIRRELKDGALSSLRLAALPLIAALGGVVVPALIYLASNPDPADRNGWAIPTATDIAFAVGVLALLGKAVPGNLRVLLLAIAVIDDIAAVLIIAIFYSNGFDLAGVAWIAGGVITLSAMRRACLRPSWICVAAGVPMWIGFLKAGIHPALVGVALGALLPGSARHMEESLQPYVVLGIMPLFALANAGVGIDAEGMVDGSSVAFGTALALAVGKPLGVLAATRMGVYFGWCSLPVDVTWSRMVVIGVLAGIGFTMSIFIATLAFPDGNQLAPAKIGVLAGSTISAVAGLLLGHLLLRRSTRH